MNSGGDYQRQNHRDCDAADYSDGKRLQHLRTGAERQRQWQHTGMAASAVITIGRKRRRPACTMASRGEYPWARYFWSASSSRMPFFATMPITMISPMNDEILNVVPVISRARRTPDVDSSAERQDRQGRGKGAELERAAR